MGKRTKGNCEEEEKTKDEKFCQTERVKGSKLKNESVYDKGKES